MKLMTGTVFVFMAALAHADWAPPTHPTHDEAHKISSEATADTRAGRYEDSLAKHLWFHQNALKVDQSLRGVRLSFALGDWVRLGALYPPAAEKLKAIREEANQDVREGRAHRQAFIDFMGINRALKESDKTEELFLWLDTNKPSVAKDVFDVAQPILIKSKKYRLCGKYIDPDISFQRILELYRQNYLDSKSDGLALRAYHKNYQENEFANSTATLVALLVLNDRKEEAVRIADQANKEWNNRELKKKLEKAKKGEFPKQ